MAGDPSPHLDETTADVSAEVQISSPLSRRAHQAMFDATLKEIFLERQVTLREPIGAESKETIVYGGLFHGNEVAVKLFTLATDDPRDAISAYGAFKVECEKTMILSRSHDSVIKVMDYGDVEVPDDLADELQGFFSLGLVPFMITERAPFGSLDKAMKQIGVLPGFTRNGLIKALIQATDGIKAAHEHQVAHRDIKPQNILIFSPDSGRIADFGIARWRSRMQSAEATMLTPRYSSPEQAFHALTGEHEERVGIRGDIYSWAIMVYELVTGTHPFEWALQDAKTGLRAKKSILRAIAANDRRGFVPTGDITFDSLMHSCTADHNRRIRDISKANDILRQYVERQR